MRVRQILPFAVNLLWLQKSRAGYQHLVGSLENPRSVQEQYLKFLLQNNAGTQYGQINRFSQIASIHDFETKVPLTRYENYLPYLEAISQGKPLVLTRDPVLLFQPTSGSSAASKLIPYNKSLKVEYQRAISAWIYSLYQQVPGIMRGRAYWSVSPAVEREKSYGDIPIGFDDDSQYLGKLGKQLFNLVSVKQIKFAPNTSVDDFWEQTLINLLGTRNLSLISVWSPTFLLTIVKYLRENRAEIIEILKTDNSPRVRARAEEIERAIQKWGIDFEAIWPDLKLISCWVHGTSEIYISEIRKYFPNVKIQGKGLVATEAFISLPLLPGKDPVLAVTSHFFEFRDVETGEIHLAHELRDCGVYSVIVTTSGGLYRYELNDLVEVTGYIAATPTLRFISKNTVSDLFGEKLNIEHVQRSIAQAFTDCFLVPTFILMAPVKTRDQKIFYTLFFHSQDVTDSQMKMLRDKLEALLLESYHYAYCQKLGQLARLGVFLIDSSVVTPEVIFLKEMSRRGQKLGDVKPSVLDQEFGWEKRFPGRFLDIVNS